MMGTQCLLCYSALRSLRGTAEQIKASAHFTAGTSEAAPRDSERAAETEVSQPAAGVGSLVFPSVALVQPRQQIFHGPESLDRQTVSRADGLREPSRPHLPTQRIPWKVLPSSVSHTCLEQRQLLRWRLWAVLSASIPPVLSQEVGSENDLLCPFWLGSGVRSVRCPGVRVGRPIQPPRNHLPSKSGGLQGLEAWSQGSLRRAGR